MNLRDLAFTSTLVCVSASTMPAFAETPSGSYRGVLVCERFKNAPDILRAPLDMRLNGTDARFGRPLFNVMGTRTIGTELAAGTIDADGKLHLTSSWTAGDVAFQGVYEGTLAASGGTFNGTQTWTGPGDNGGHRACIAAVLPAPAANPQAVGDRRP